MTAAIPFEREMTFEYGVLEQVAPGVRRLVADNPGPFTYTGTGVYVIGEGEVAVIDPGPDTFKHRAALLSALDGERVSHVFVTHHHIDHSPMAVPLARAHRCLVFGYGGLTRTPAGGEVRLEAGDHIGFRPDVEISDGDVFNGPGWTIEAIHTPGHTSNHMTYAFREANALFCGDHVMAWSTSVVSPPDGDMGAYLRSLHMIKARGFGVLWPTHGPPIRDPRTMLDAFIAHRRAREAQILDRLAAGDDRIIDMVRVMYADVDRRLHPAACHSVLAHLIHLVEDGYATCDGGLGLSARYSLTARAA